MVDKLEFCPFCESYVQITSKRSPYFYMHSVNYSLIEPSAGGTITIECDNVLECGAKLELMFGYGEMTNYNEALEKAIYFFCYDKVIKYYGEVPTNVQMFRQSKLIGDGLRQLVRVINEANESV